MYVPRKIWVPFIFGSAWLIWSLSAFCAGSVHVGEFMQEAHEGYTTSDGLPSLEIQQLAIGDGGNVYAKTNAGVAVFVDGKWRDADDDAENSLFEPLSWYPGLAALMGSPVAVRDCAQHGEEIAIAAGNGLYVGDGEKWEHVFPVEGNIGWAPLDVRAVTYDSKGHLWFAAPQGVGCRITPKEWMLFTGAQGLPYNDFTCIAAGKTGVWFGTSNGAIHYDGREWRFRQGRRWLLDNYVRDIVVDEAGDAWFATAAGVSRITRKSMTLSGKAAFYEEEIERYHRRTRFGYVNPAVLSVPGDKSTAIPRYSDNDGFNTGLYLGAMSFAYAVTRDEKYREYARNSFRALAFLSEVTQGGPYGGPPGLIARNVVPTTEPDPGVIYDRNYDIARNRRDALWKIMERRIPVDKTGSWYWKCDASSDELDGHFFGYAIYFDCVCETEKEKDDVRSVVRPIIDHLIAHGYNLVDYDGNPTRWGHLSPDDLNANPDWHDERGLNSYSILTYLSIAGHITGDEKYRREYLNLALEHGYGMNGMTQPKALSGPNDPGHQPDDNMAFMNYYHLIRYETDPGLLSMYLYAIQQHWKYERLERNAFTNFIYGACVEGKTRTDQWGETALSPSDECYEDAVDTLKRYPLDLIEWPMSNAHRIDMKPVGEQEMETPKMGGRYDGYAFPVDERNETYWDWDPWDLSSQGDGTTLRPGFHYLLAYYLGCYHGFIEE